MYSIRKISGLLLSAFMAINCFANAALRYEQALTLSNSESEEAARKLVHDFRQATVYDPNIMIVNVRYEQDKMDDETTWYHAIITCHVSEIDEDIARGKGRMVQDLDLTEISQI